MAQATAAVSKEAVLKTEYLGIAFGGLKAVDDFNIELYPGELVGLIGPNGAGKTTVFNLLTGVYMPTEGKIFFEGKLLNGKKPYQCVAAGMARTFQNIRLFKKLSVLDNIKVAFGKDIKYRLFGSVFRSPLYLREEADMDARARDLLKIFHMEDKAEYIAQNLPYGQQRKLEIARALATGMKLLLLDEPAAGMNPTETQELLECINLIRERFKITILLIEHDMSLVMNICERIVVLDYGRIIAAGTPDQISKDPKVIAAYLGADD
ncbi:MAG: ABC transporter ATP-binding protein [Fusobacteriaceae bacterium]|jgi:branched-chain amino acid transport system ATP-binding protein|nr:ABC transporter ATP-binding protein [Fusobacteriaceae bacterium]